MARTTTQRGLGWEHRQQVAFLLRDHRDGAPCPCLDDGTCGPGCLCRPAGRGLPMYRDRTRNPDGRQLQADHTQARSQGGRRADRLMLATCNASRGDGTRAPQAPAGTPDWWTERWMD